MIASDSLRRSTSSLRAAGDGRRLFIPAATASFPCAQSLAKRTAGPTNTSSARFPKAYNWITRATRARTAREALAALIALASTQADSAGARRARRRMCADGARAPRDVKARAAPMRAAALGLQRLLDFLGDGRRLLLRRRPAHLRQRHDDQLD